MLAKQVSPPTEGTVTSAAASPSEARRYRCCRCASGRRRPYRRSGRGRSSPAVPKLVRSGGWCSGPKCSAKATWLGGDRHVSKDEQQVTEQGLADLAYLGWSDLARRVNSQDLGAEGARKRTDLKSRHGILPVVGGGRHSGRRYGRDPRPQFVWRHRLEPFSGRHLDGVFHHVHASSRREKVRIVAETDPDVDTPVDGGLKRWS